MKKKKQKSWQTWQMWCSVMTNGRHGHPSLPSWAGNPGNPPDSTPPALKGAGHGKRDIDTSDSESVHSESVLNRFTGLLNTKESWPNIFKVGWLGQTHLWKSLNIFEPGVSWQDLYTLDVCRAARRVAGDDAAAAWYTTPRPKGIQMKSKHVLLIAQPWNLTHTGSIRDHTCNSFNRERDHVFFACRFPDVPGRWLWPSPVTHSKVEHGRHLSRRTQRCLWKQWMWRYGSNPWYPGEHANNQIIWHIINI